MSPPSSEALTKFACFNWPAGYTEAVEDRQVRVFPVRVKTGIGAARHTMMSHVVGEAAGVLIDGQITYSARWVCAPIGAVDAVFLTDEQAAASDSTCRFCFPRVPDAGDCMYRICDADGVLVYIGHTENLPARIAGHRKTASWRHRIADVQATTYPSILAAKAAEVAAIRAEDPECNILHRNRTPVVA